MSYTENLVNALALIGVNINLFTLQPKRKELQKSGITVKHFPLSKIIWMTPRGNKRKQVERLILEPWFGKMVKTNSINVIHTNFASNSEAFLKAKNDYEIPLIYTNHYVPEIEPLESLSYDDFSFNEREKVWIPRMCEQASKVVTVSEYAKRRLKEVFGIDSECIYHGVDLKKYNPSLPKNKESLGFNSDEKIVLYVARFGHHPYKDPFTFVRSIPLVLRQCPKTKFVMVGKGTLIPHVVDLAKKLGVDKNLVILDFVERLNLFFAASDVFVLPSYNDNFGLVAAEAMACGIPVVVSDHGAPQEFVQNSGLIFEYGSHQDLSDKLVALLVDEDLSMKIGKRSFDHIANNFSWEKAAKKYSKLYQKII